MKLIRLNDGAFTTDAFLNAMGVLTEGVSKYLEPSIELHVPHEDFDHACKICQMLYKHTTIKAIDGFGWCVSVHMDGDHLGVAFGDTL